MNISADVRGRDRSWGQRVKNIRHGRQDIEVTLYLNTGTGQFTVPTPYGNVQGTSLDTVMAEVWRTVDGGLVKSRIDAIVCETSSLNQGYSNIGSRSRSLNLAFNRYHCIITIADQLRACDWDTPAADIDSKATSDMWCRCVKTVPGRYVHKQSGFGDTPDSETVTSAFIYTDTLWQALKTFDARIEDLNSRLHALIGDDVKMAEIASGARTLKLLN